MNSNDIQNGLDNFEIDLGLTYLDNEPILRVNSVPLYRERYRLLVPLDGPFGGRDTVTWREASEVPLCLLTTDMQNRRIIDAAFQHAGCRPVPQIETNSIASLGLHVQTGQWSSVVPHHVLLTLGLPKGARALDITEPDVSHAVGVVTADREPAPPTAKAMLVVIHGLAKTNLFESIE
jgi:DNA-binding transcriptional LysR family regulator